MEYNTLKGRCSVLIDMVRNLKKTYIEADQNQQAFIETIIGAALFYIPHPKDCWTGKISLAAIKDFHPSSTEIYKLSPEHEVPRKIAARELLNNTPDKNTFEKLYIEKYSKIHYLTPTENKLAIKFQKENVYNNDPDEVYRKANIHLIMIDKEILKRIKQRDAGLIDSILKQYNY